MLFTLDEVDPSWRPFFSQYVESINQILQSFSGDITPPRSEVFKAFRTPIDEIRVLIVGQDPYPGEGVADGLAFSTHEGNPVPASLRNIFKEYAQDLNLPIPESPDLTQWSGRGVLLLNRTLTTDIGERNAHLSDGWSAITEAVARELATRDVIAILWGNNARTLAPHFSYLIESVHPSPLSARRGFFGSRPFSKANEMLVAQGKAPINWQL